MVITKVGSLKSTGEFHFVCSKCGAEWYLSRGDKELKISPPCCEFYTYSYCPYCKEFNLDSRSREEQKKK